MQLHESDTRQLLLIVVFVVLGPSGCQGGGGSSSGPTSNVSRKSESPTNGLAASASKDDIRGDSKSQAVPSDKDPGTSENALGGGTAPAEQLAAPQGKAKKKSQEQASEKQTEVAPVATAKQKEEQVPPNTQAESPSPAPDDAQAIEPPRLELSAPVSTPGRAVRPLVKITSTKAGDIVYGGSCKGELSNLGSGVTAEVSLTSSGGGDLSDGTYTDCTIQISDATGAKSSVLKVPSFTIDATGPTLSISSADVGSGKSTEKAAVGLTLRFSEPIKTFTLASMRSEGCLLAELEGSGLSRQVVCKASEAGPVSVEVKAGALADALGNTNENAESYGWTFEIIPPTMTVASKSVAEGALTNSSPVALTFQSSKPTSDFALADIRAEGCTLAKFSGKGKNYKAQCKATKDGPVRIDVQGGVFTSVYGVTNDSDSGYGWSHDGTPPEVTTAVARVKNNGRSSKAKASLTFDLTESVENFEAKDVRASGCNLSDFSGSETTYTAQCTAKADKESPIQPVVVNVSKGAFRDAAGNGNKAASKYSWYFLSKIHRFNCEIVCANRNAANCAQGEGQTNCVTKCFSPKCKNKLLPVWGEYVVCESENAYSSDYECVDGKPFYTSGCLELKKQVNSCF